MGSAAKALSGLGQEYSGTGSGLQSRLTPTAVSALPVSLTTGINAASLNGERLAIGVYNHTASGTIAVAGTAPLSLAVVSETSSSIPVAELPGEVMWYVTSGVYGAVNASGVTLGAGLTGGTVVIYGIQAANRLLVGEIKLSEKTKEHSPVEQRGVYDQDFHLLALAVDGEWEYTGDFYADVAAFAYLGGYAAAPTVATLPAAPTSLKTATSVASSGNFSLASQPTAPGMILKCVIAGGPASAATVTISGTNQFGAAISEVVVPSTQSNGTFYSTNVFASVNANGVVYGAFGGAATLAITGIYGFKYSGNPGDTLQSFALEQYDSTASWAAPYCLVTEWTIEGGAEKEAKVTAKGPAQRVLPVGNPATATNQVTAFGQPPDKPLTGWRASVTIDALSGTIGTTQNADVVDWKVTTKLEWTPRHTSWGNPPTRMWHVAYRKRRSVEVELTLDMTATSFQNEYLAWLRRNKRLVQLTIVGPYMGTDSGTTWNEGCVLNLPLRWIEVAERDYAPSTESVIIKLKGRCEYEPSLGYSHNFTWFSHLAAW